jgi:hypothetical protein
MGTYLDIVVCRHPNAKEDTITPEGGMKAIALAHRLQQSNLEASCILYSNTGRTKQAAHYMAIAADLLNLHPQEDRAFNFMEIIRDRMKGNVMAMNENADEIISKGGTVHAALSLNAYARRARDHMRFTLQMVATHMMAREERIAWVVSHGQLSEMAITDRIKDDVPYGINHCDAIIYRLSCSKDDCEIIKAEYLPFDSIEKKELEDED